MAIELTIRLSQLEGQKRIDAEYYQPEYCKLRHKLSQIRTKRIKELSTSVVSFGAYSLCNYIIWREKGIPYLNVENIREGYIDWEGVKYIDKDVHEILRKSQVKEGQVIITMAGTIGNAAVAYKLPKEANSNQATAKITLKTGASPFFLAAFLNSYFGKKQTEWEIVTSVQPNIFLWQIKNIRVPMVSKEIENEVEKFYKQGLNQLELSKSLYSQAENLLLEELGLKDFKPRYKKTYTANLSDAFSVHRIDAEYFQPAYEEVVEKLRENNIELKPLKSVFDFRRGVFVSTDYYTEEKTDRPYIRIKELTGKIGINEDEVIYINDTYPEDPTNKLHENDLVIAIIGDTIGKTNRVYRELAGGFCSNNTGLLRIRADIKEKIMAEYAEILFQSFVIQSQIEKKKAQTGQPKISDSEIKSIYIPLLPFSTQQKIASLVQQSHEARKKAKKLLEIAKRSVEIAIEKNEDEALDYLNKF